MRNREERQQLCKSQPPRRASSRRIKFVNAATSLLQHSAGVDRLAQSTKQTPYQLMESDRRPPM